MKITSIEDNTIKRGDCIINTPLMSAIQMLVDARVSDGESGSFRIIVEYRKKKGIPEHSDGIAFEDAYELDDRVWLVPYGTAHTDSDYCFFYFDKCHQVEYDALVAHLLRMKGNVVSVEVIGETIELCNYPMGLGGEYVAYSSLFSRYTD